MTGRAVTLARIPPNRGLRQRRLVLPVGPGCPGGQPGDSSRPAEQAAATCQALTGPRTPNAPNRPLTAAVAAPNAASTSRHADPRALGTTRSTPARWATPSNHVRTASNRPPITRNQPRTLTAGTPNLAPDHPMPRPTRPGHQRRTDHLDPIRTPQQHRDRQQDMGDQTHGATGPPRVQHPRKTLDTAWARPPPRTQRAQTIRTDHLPRRQPRLDPNLICLYRHQRVPPCIQHGPPAAVLHDTSGRAVVVSTQLTRRSDGDDETDQHTNQSLRRRPKPQ